MNQRKSLFWLVMSIMTSLLLVQAVGASNGRIVGGEEATPGEFPWMVSIQNRSGFHFCGGSLIASDWVLTASHCTENASASQIQVVIGRHDLTSNEGQTITVSEIVMHPNYNSNSLNNDVALLRLSTAVSGVTPIGLVSDEMTVDDPDQATTISGWGTLSSGGPSPDKLQKVEVPIVSNATCSSSYPGQITAQMICAGLAEGGKDSCQGDSGGPMMVRDAAGTGWLQAGIVSWGNGCAWAGYYGVYARVSELKSWIDNEIGNATPPTEATATGVVTAVSADSISIDDAATTRAILTFAIDGNTVINGTPQAGDTVDVRYTIATNAAVEITVDDGGTAPPPPSERETVDGVVTAISDDSITVDVADDTRAEQTFIIDHTTNISGSPQVGDEVRVRYDVATNIAIRIRVVDNGGGGGGGYDSVSGTVTAIDETSITVDVSTQTGVVVETFTLDTYTWMPVTPEVGDSVRVDYDTGTLVAYSVSIIGGGPGNGETARTRGTVVAIDETSISIEAETETRMVVEMFIIDENTDMREMPEVGDEVRIRYETDTGVAIRIRIINNNGGGGQYERHQGVVTDIQPDSITIEYGSEAISRTVVATATMTATFAIDGMTWMPEPVEVGDEVRVVIDVETQTAISIRKVDGEPPVNTYDRIRGTVTAISAMSITIETDDDERMAAYTFTIDADTGIDGDPQVGDRVRVEYNTETMVALSIRVVGDGGGWPGWPGQDEYVEITGTLDAISDTAYTVDGVDYLVNRHTYVEGELQVSDTVYIFAEVDGDTFVALYIAPYDAGFGGGEEFEFDWGGMVTEILSDSITVRNVWFGMESEDTFIINGDTVIDGAPVVGDFVEIHALYHADGTMTALEIEVKDDTGPTIERYEGVVTDIVSGSLTIDTEDEMRAAVTFAVTDETTFRGTPEMGDYVRVKAERDADGNLTALYVRVDEPEPVFTTVRGTVTEILSDSITVDDGVTTTVRALTTFAIDENTLMRETPEVGDRVRVKGTELDGVLTAVEIRVRDEPTEPVEYVEVIGTLETTSTAEYTVDGIAYTIDVDTVIEGSPTISDTVYVFAEAQAGSFKALYIAKFDQPAERFELEGNLDAFVEGVSVTVDGQVISVTADTKIRGELAVDATVFVKGTVDADGTMVAKRIRVRGDDGGERFVEALGEISATSATEITVDGTTFAIDADETDIEGTPAVGLMAYAVGVNKDGVTTALFIQVVDEQNMTGQIEDLTANGLTVNGQTIRINNRTRINGNFTVGDMVYIGLDNGARAAQQDALLISTSNAAPSAVQLNNASTLDTNVMWLLTVVFATLTAGTLWLSRRRSL